MKNILTFDIEEWYDANYPTVDFWGVDFKKSSLETEIKVILDLCAEYQAKATFFVLGRVAEEKPHLIKAIQEKGHEVASHGYEHKLVYGLSPDLFREDLRKSLEVLEPIIGKKILGYRAPSWSFNEKTSWAYSILAELDLKYSASVFPIKTSLYGLSDAPRFPYSVKVGDAGDKDILEIPTSTLKMFGQNIPFSGGFYFRFWPSFLVRAAIKKVNQEGQPAILYLHPREIDPSSLRLKLPLRENFLHYWAVSQTKDKLENILKRYQFGSIESELLPKYSL